MQANQGIPATPADPLARHARWGLLAVLLVALALRLWGIRFGLPYLEHPDEPGYVRIAQNIFTSGDLNPHFFNYPSLFFYLNALAYGPYQALGQIAGQAVSPQEIAAPIVLIGGSGKTDAPATFLLGRGLTVLFGCATVAFAFVLGRRLTGGRGSGVIAGMLAGLWLALSPTHVANSRYIAPDVFLAFFLLLTFWASLQILESGRWRDYLVAGIAVGLVGSTKYNGILVALLPTMAHFLRYGRQGWRKPEILLTAAMAVLAFLATTPYALLDNGTFLHDLRLEAKHYSTGHPGFEGGALAWYGDYLLRTEGLVVAMAAAGIVLAFARRSRPLILLALFPLAYFAFISSFAVRNDRTALPLLPFFCVLAAIWLTAAWVWLKDAGLEPHVRMAGYLTIGGLIGLSVLLPLTHVTHETAHLTRPDGRDTAREWIEANLSPGSRFALESYSPWVDPQRYSVQGLYKLADHDLAWYQENGYDYLVFSQRMFRRFYDEPKRYQDEVARYDALFAGCEELKSFADGGYEVRVCRLPRRQPS